MLDLFKLIILIVHRSQITISGFHCITKQLRFLLSWFQNVYEIDFRVKRFTLPSELRILCFKTKSRFCQTIFIVNVLNFPLNMLNVWQLQMTMVNVSMFQSTVFNISTLQITHSFNHFTKYRFTISNYCF